MQVTCPHCSRPFESELSGTQFCPHCGGQLEVPASAAASSTPVSAPAPSPSAGWVPPGNPHVTATAATPEATPWERRAQLGPVQGFWQTWKQTVLSPMSFWPTVSPQGTLWDGISYAWVVRAIATLLSLPFSYANRGAMLQGLDSMQSNLPPESRVFLTKVTEHAMAGGVGVMLGMLLIYPALLVMGAGFFHLCALITGAGKEGFGATLRVVSYASAVQAVAFHGCVAVPATLYQIVLIALGMQVVHRTTTGKAVFALVLPLLLCCVCCCVGSLSVGALASRLNLGH